MEIFDENKLKEMLSPLDNDVCGESLEYDDLYLGLDELALGVPASQMGDSIIEGKDPDFKKLQSSCLKLWEKTRDLRVAAFFTLSSLTINGIQGLLNGLSVINYLIENMYDNFYPQLDPDDDNDPTERINILSMLSPEEGAFSDPFGFIANFRKIKLVDELPYNYRDYLIAAGFLESNKEGNSIDLNIINTQMSSIPSSSVQKQIAIIDECLSLTKNICDQFNNHAKDTGYLTMDSLERELGSLRNFYKNYTSNNISDTEEVVEKKDEPKEIKVNQQKAVDTSSFFNLDSFIPSNRNEALLLLKKSADYFNKAEPNSPVPFLIDRALRMANMNFIDLLQEIDSNAADRGREQLGVKKKEEYESY